MPKKNFWSDEQPEMGGCDNGSKGGGGDANGNCREYGQSQHPVGEQERDSLAGVGVSDDLIAALICYCGMVYSLGPVPPYVALAGMGVILSVERVSPGHVLTHPATLERLRNMVLAMWKDGKNPAELAMGLPSGYKDALTRVYRVLEPRYGRSASAGGNSGTGRGGGWLS